MMGDSKNKKERGRVKVFVLFLYCVLGISVLVASPDALSFEISKIRFGMIDGVMKEAVSLIEAANASVFLNENIVGDFRQYNRFLSLSIKSIFHVPFKGAEMIFCSKLM